MRMLVHTARSWNDSTRWMSSCRVESSSSSDRNGRGLKSHTSTYEQHTHDAARKRRGKALEKELKQDVAAPGAERLADADFARALLH